MKSTGITRRVDHLGRVVVPKEIRREFGIEKKDSVEIFVEGDKIIFRKYQPGFTCAITGEITPENKQYADNLYLSPEGARILFDKLKEELDSN